MTNSRMIFHMSYVGQVLKKLHSFEPNLIVWIDCQNILMHFGGIKLLADKKISLHESYNCEKYTVRELIDMLSTFDADTYILLDYHYDLFKIKDIILQDNSVIIQG